MLKNQNEVTAAALEKFILSKKLCVLHAFHGTGYGFNKYLNDLLLKKHLGLISTGSLNLSKVDYKHTKISDFVKKWIPNLGLPHSAVIYPGYYLFRDGILIGYHPGTVDPKYMDPKVDGVLTIFSAAIALLVGIIEKSAAKGFKTFVEGIMASNGLKVFHFFEDILKIRDWSETKAKHKITFEDELSKAYKLLNVTPESTDEEINKSWRKLMNEHHPDKSTKDKEARTKLTAEINEAYRLIKATRTRKKKEQPIS